MRAVIIKNGAVINATKTETLIHPDGLEMVYSDIATVGWTYADGQLVPPPEPEITPEQVNSQRDQKINSGMPYTFPDGAGVVDIKNDRDIINITGLGVAALALVVSGDTTTKLEYRDEKNVTHKMTAQETVAFGLAFMQWYAEKYKESWETKDILKGVK